MARYVVLLRGVNVGGHATLAMADLRALLRRLGYDDVRTHLRSGNAVVCSPCGEDELAGQVEAALAREFARPVACVVRSGDAMAGVVAGNPFPERAAAPSKLAVTFLSAAADPERLSGVRAGDYRPDEFRVSGREIYQWFPSGIHVSKLSGAFWEKRLQVTATARNWNTVLRLTQMSAG